MSHSILQDQPVLKSSEGRIANNFKKLPFKIISFKTLEYRPTTYNRRLHVTRTHYRNLWLLVYFYYHTINSC